LLKDGGFELKRQGRGDHEIWSSVNNSEVFDFESEPALRG